MSPEERSPAELDPLPDPDEGTPGEKGGTPDPASPTKGGEGEKTPSLTPPKGSDTERDVASLNKRIEDQQKEITRRQMAEADLRREMAVIRAGGSPNTGGEAPMTPAQKALKAKLAGDPDYLDNPESQVEEIARRAGEYAASAIERKDEANLRSQFAQQARELRSDINIAALDTIYDGARLELKRAGSDKNPYIAIDDFLRKGDIEVKPTKTPSTPAIPSGSPAGKPGASPAMEPADKVKGRMVNVRDYLLNYITEHPENFTRK